MREVDGYVYGAEVIALRALDGYRLWLRFKGGEEKVYDFKPLLERSIGTVFEPLMDKALFESVYIFTGAVAWSDRLDFDSCCLYNGGVPASEDSLTAEERARPVVERDRWLDHPLYEYIQLLNGMDEDEYDAVMEKRAPIPESFPARYLDRLKMDIEEHVSLMSDVFDAPDESSSPVLAYGRARAPVAAFG